MPPHGLGLSRIYVHAVVLTLGERWQASTSGFASRLFLSYEDTLMEASGNQRHGEDDPQFGVKSEKPDGDARSGDQLVMVLRCTSAVAPGCRISAWTRLHCARLPDAGSVKNTIESTSRLGAEAETRSTGDPLTMLPCWDASLRGKLNTFQSF